MSDRALLPLLDDTHEIDDATVEAFRRDGHALVRGLCSTEEVEAWRPLLVDAMRDNAWDQRPLDERDTYGRAFLQAANLWRQDERITAFTLSARFARVAARLLGVDAVRLYHDQGLLKEAGGGRTPWHQDQQYWPLDGDGTVTMWMPLVDVPPEVGSMTFASGTHTFGDLADRPDAPISDESDAAHLDLIEREGLATVSHGALRAGDATFHHGWTLHSAGPNPTDRDRPVMTVIWFADGSTVTEPTSPFQELDRALWLGDLPAGSVAAGPLNPVVG